MMNWTTGEQVGWWQYIGEQELEEGLSCDYWPWVEVEGGAWMEPVPVHRHPEGYWCFRVPKGGGKVLIHRQLWQDRSGGRLGAGWEIHHRDGVKGNSCFQNLQRVRGRLHRQEHARQRRHRAPRRG